MRLFLLWYLNKNLVYQDSKGYSNKKPTYVELLTKQSIISDRN